MTKEIKVSASILCADFANLEQEIKICENAGIDMLHMDVMDGHFVPNITMGPLIIETIRKKTRLSIDTHLMIENPGVYIDKFIDAGSDRIAIHSECYGERREGCRQYGEYPKEIDNINFELLQKDIDKIKQKGAEAVVVLNPGTPDCLGDFVDNIDGVLIMSVNPGFAKQKFMPISLSKIESLRKRFNGDIATDGGINADTASQVVNAGANILVTASYFFGSSDKKKAVDFFKSLRKQN